MNLFTIHTKSIRKQMFLPFTILEVASFETCLFHSIFEFVIMEGNQISLPFWSMLLWRENTLVS